MSTRATYRFFHSHIGKRGRRCLDESEPDTYIYIHSDGYPNGAADYFRKALSHCKGEELTCESFIRANKGARIIRGHDNHVDTEFRYDYDFSTCNIVASKLLFTSKGGGIALEDVYSGVLSGFVEKSEANCI